jgi:putative transcriptional regulator
MLHRAGFIGLRISELRRRNSLSRTDLAEKLGVTRQTIIAIENDKYDPTLELAMKLSEFFGISVNDIFHLSH